MPKQKKFKEKVRARQERDGVSYSEARRIEHQKIEWPWQFDPAKEAFDLSEEVPPGAHWCYDFRSRGATVLALREGKIQRLLESEWNKDSRTAVFVVPEITEPPSEELVQKFIEQAKREELLTFLVHSGNRRGLIAYHKWHRKGGPEVRAPSFPEHLFDHVDHVLEPLALWSYKYPEDSYVVFLDNEKVCTTRHPNIVIVPQQDSLSRETVEGFLAFAKERGLTTHLVRSKTQMGLVACSKPFTEKPFPLLGEDQEGQKVRLTRAQMEENRREEAFQAWLRENPGPHEVKLRLQYNENGVPTVSVEAQKDGEIPMVFSVAQPPLAYAEAIRRGIEDAKWAKDPHDDLGDLPECSA